MANYVFKRDNAGVRNLLQSQECMKTIESFASKYANGEKVRSFIGYDRAKCFVSQKRSKK